MEQEMKMKPSLSDNLIKKSIDFLFEFKALLNFQWNGKDFKQ